MVDNTQRRKPNWAIIAWEALSGLFGWIWIIGGLATLVFAGLAILGDQGWRNATYSLISSVVGKWLSRGCEENKRRVIFESKMIDCGKSMREAEMAWTEALQVSHSVKVNIR